LSSPQRLQIRPSGVSFRLTYEGVRIRGLTIRTGTSASLDMRRRHARHLITQSEMAAEILSQDHPEWTSARSVIVLSESAKVSVSRSDWPQSTQARSAKHAVSRCHTSVSRLILDFLTRSRSRVTFAA